jgi:tetratricopeptide (TPR) repeat protein
LTRVDAHLGLARLAAAANEDADALRHLELARAEDKGNWRVHLARGNFHFARQQLDEAAAAYREAAQLAPDEAASPWTNLGGVHLALNDYAQASTALYRSVAAEPTHGALNNLGLVRFYLGDYAEAAALLRRAVALAPGDYRGWGNLGDALSETAQGEEEAARSYRRAAIEAERLLALNPDNAEVTGALAWYQASLGDADQARALLARAERLGGEDALAVRAAQLHARLGDHASAERSVRRALDSGRSPRELSALPVLAPVLARMDGPSQLLRDGSRRDVSQQDIDEPG